VLDAYQGGAAVKVLVACEFSGVVRDALLARGHDAVSCDLIPSEKPGPHIQGDVLEHLGEGWDLMIAFPPCTHLSWASGRYLVEKRANGLTESAISFVKKLRRAPIRKMAIENPRGDLWKALRRPDQVIQPWMFGDPWQKTTCLWLYNLPRLVPTKLVSPIGKWVDAGSGKRRGLHRSPIERAKTFPRVANAMADQWGGQP
jgi:hypothetical protein